MSRIRRQLLSIIVSSGPAPAHEFVIHSDDVFVGKTLYCRCYYDGQQVAGQWSLAEGSQYASINQNGRIDVNEGVQDKQLTVRCQYDGQTAEKTVTVSYDNQLTIECADVIRGSSATVVARYNGQVVTAAWSRTGGTADVTVSVLGEMTIASSGTVVVQASYSGYTTTKTIEVEYVPGSSSQTVINDDGSVTTKTESTTTNPDGSTTTETTSTTTGQDGSYSQTSSETTVNQDGSSTTSSSTVNQDGSSSRTQSSTTAPDAQGAITTSTSTVNYDADGQTTGSQTSQTTARADGSSSSSTINYNAAGDPTDGQNVDVDASGNENTQDLEYDEGGNPVVTGYTIDTSGNPSGGGETISGGLDTGFIAFDGRPFQVHLKAKTNPSDNSNKMFIAALEEMSDKPNYYKGFAVGMYGTTSVIGYASKTGSRVLNQSWGSRITGHRNDGSTANVQTLQYLHKGVQEITIDVTYYPSEYSPEYKWIKYAAPLYTSTTGGSKKSVNASTLVSNSGYFPDRLDNAEVFVGSYGIEHAHDAVDFEVLEFEIRKI